MPISRRELQASRPLAGRWKRGSGGAATHLPGSAGSNRTPTTLRTGAHLRVRLFVLYGCFPAHIRQMAGKTQQLLRLAEAQVISDVRFKLLLRQGEIRPVPAPVSSTRAFRGSSRRI